MYTEHIIILGVDFTPGYTSKILTFTPKITTCPFIGCYILMYGGI